MTDLNAVATAGFPKTVTLPVSGIEAHVLKRPQGREMRLAGKAARGKGGAMDPIAYQFAIFTQIVRFGEKKEQWRIDQLEELTESDIGALTQAISGDADEDDAPLS